MSEVGRPELQVWGEEGLGEMEGVGPELRVPGAVGRGQRWCGLRVQHWQVEWGAGFPKWELEGKGLGVGGVEGVHRGGVRSLAVPGFGRL